MEIAELSPAEANARLAELHVVDVRAEHEFRGPLGRVRGARLVPLPQLEARARELPTGRPLLLVCRSGARSGKACAQLAALGIGPVVNLAGGMIAWNRSQLPVETTEPGSLRELCDGVAAWLAQVTGRPRDAAGAQLRGWLEGAGASLERPSHAAVDGALDAVERSFAGAEAPADLALALASFRRSLAAL
jgi:rhodanese-related sulfurtransferase